MVTVEVATPLAITGPVPTMLEFAATTGPGAKTTVPPVRLTGLVSESVLVSAVVEERVHVEIPLELLLEQAP